MLHHVSFGVRNLALSGAFYDAAFLIDPDGYHMEVVINNPLHREMQ